MFGLNVTQSALEFYQQFFEVFKLEKEPLLNIPIDVILNSVKLSPAFRLSNLWTSQWY